MKERMNRQKKQKKGSVQQKRSTAVVERTVSELIQTQFRIFFLVILLGVSQHIVSLSLCFKATIISIFI